MGLEVSHYWMPAQANWQNFSDGGIVSNYYVKTVLGLDQNLYSG